MSVKTNNTLTGQIVESSLKKSLTLLCNLRICRMWLFFLGGGREIDWKTERDKHSTNIRIRIKTVIKAVPLNNVHDEMSWGWGRHFNSIRNEVIRLEMDEAFRTTGNTKKQYSRFHSKKMCKHMHFKRATQVSTLSTFKLPCAWAPFIAHFSTSCWMNRC